MVAVKLVKIVVLSANQLDEEEFEEEVLAGIVTDKATPGEGEGT